MNASSLATPTSVPRSHLLAQHLELMFKQTKAVFGGNFLMASLTVFALWDFADHRRLFVWAGLVFLLTFARIGFVVRYRRAKPGPTRWGRGRRKRPRTGG